MARWVLDSREGLGFFGRIVAGTTHELVNILNIVGELAGLQDDLVHAAAEGQPLDPARLASLAARTRTQAERGHTLLRHLNRFAHSADAERQLYDVGELLESFASLTERFARLSRVSLACHPPHRTVVLEGNPFAVHLALFLCLDAALASASSQRAVSLQAEPEEGGVLLVVEGADPVAPAATEALTGRLAQVLPACPAQLASLPGANDRFRVCLRLVSGPPAGTEEKEADCAS
mgnify:CR=1 FL=1